MASFKDLMTIANDSGFQKRVQFCVEKAAVAVMAESNTTSGHVLRVQYAHKVLAGLGSYLEWATAVVTNSTIASEANATTTPDFAIPDSDIEFVVNSMYNAFSGNAT